MDRQAKEAKEMTKQLKGKEKWKNFWYYYKFHIIAIIFAVLLVSYSLAECIGKVKLDLSVSCYTATLIDDSKVNVLCDEFKKNIDDITGNDQIDVDIVVNMTDISTPSEQTQAVFMKFSAELAAGESFGYILDDRFLAMLKNGNEDCFDAVIPIHNIPLIKETFSLEDGQNLYWLTKAVYENEKNNEKKFAAHENAVKIHNYLTELSK